MNLKLWDERECHVGEGPVAIGPNNSEVIWVDIYGKKVHRRNLETGKTSVKVGSVGFRSVTIVGTVGV